jgi:hypothetical protein
MHRKPASAEHPVTAEMLRSVIKRLSLSYPGTSLVGSGATALGSTVKEAAKLVAK